MYSVRLTRRPCHSSLRRGFGLYPSRWRNPPSARVAGLAPAESFSSALPRCIDRRGTPIELEVQDHFPGTSGFFPNPDAQPTSPEKEGLQLVKDVEKLLDRRPGQDFAHGIAPAQYIPQLFPRKIDLSYTDPQDPTSSRKLKQPLASTKQSFHHSYQTASSSFRTSNTFRWATAAYIDHVKHGGQAMWWESSQLSLDRALSLIFSGDNLAYLNSRGYDAGDIVTWAWILTSHNADRAIRRLTAVNEEKFSQEKAETPRWVVLQLLRTRHINAAPFTELVSKLLVLAHRHPLRLDRAGATYATPRRSPPNDQIGGWWDYDSATLLIVRLLRHARRVAPATFEDIARLACHLLVSLHLHGPMGYQRISYACNRLLTLTALPAGARPFYSVVYQQRAQLILVKAMMEQTPQIPLNREGYRALIKVQLAHEKLDEEKTWSEAQGDSWPPWAKAKLGIEEGTEYPGSGSRTMKVLRRMLEAGYAHHTWERIAAVLAGWDSDKSPTVQTRHILPMARAAPLAELVFYNISSPLVGELWAARITATRSVREAWACFTSYCKSVERKSRRYEPYHAMFAKLMARQQSIQPDNHVLPGDAKETFPDPSSPRDLVYIESQTPSVNDLYQQMIKDGVKPVGRLLTDLIHNTDVLAQGFEYFKDSGYSEVKKDVLQHAHRYSRDQVRSTLNSIPDHFFAAFLAMIVRCGRRADQSDTHFTIPAWFRKGEKNDTHRPSQLNYAAMLLYTSETKYLPAWNAMLEALHGRLQDLRRVGGRNFKQVSYRAWNVVGQMLWQNLDVDFTTFRIVARIIHIQLESPKSASSFPNIGFADKAKVLFARAAYKLPASWITKVEEKPVLAWPEPEDIRTLIETLGVAGDTEGLLELVKWMQSHAEALKTAEQHRQTGLRLRRINIIILRIFLEGWWVEDPTNREASMYKRSHAISQSQVAGVRQRLEHLGWPADEEVASLLESWPAWLRRVRDCMRERLTREHEKESERINIVCHATGKESESEANEESSG